MYLLEPNGTTRQVSLRRPWATDRKVIILASGDGLIITSTGQLNEFASKLANQPVFGPAILCDSNEECP